MIKLKLKLKSEDAPKKPVSSRPRLLSSVLEQPNKVEKLIEEHTKKFPIGDVPYYQWICSKDQLPPDVNEEVLVFYPEKNHFEVLRAFVTTQNVFYRITENYPIEEFYWMRFRGVHDQEHYPS